MYQVPGISNATISIRRARKVGHACLLLESSQQIQLVKLLLKPKLIQIIFAKVELNCWEIERSLRVISFWIDCFGDFQSFETFQRFFRPQWIYNLEKIMPLPICVENVEWWRPHLHVLGFVHHVSRETENLCLSRLFNLLAIKFDWWASSIALFHEAILTIWYSDIFSDCKKEVVTFQ